MTTKTNIGDILTNPLHLNEVGERHKRNLFIASFITTFLVAVPGIDPSKLVLFGLTMEDVPPQLIYIGSALFVSYFLVTFFLDCRWCWSTWTNKTLPYFNGYLRILFGFKFMRNKEIVTLFRSLDSYHQEAILSGIDDPEELLIWLQKFEYGNHYYLISIKYLQEQKSYSYPIGKETFSHIQYDIISSLYGDGISGKLPGVWFSDSDLKLLRRHVVVFYMWYAGLPILTGIVAILFCLKKIVT